MTTKNETAFTKMNEVIERMIERAFTEKQYKPPYTLSIYDGPNAADGVQLFNGQITKSEDGQFVWSRKYREDIEGVNRCTVVLKPEGNVDLAIEWHVDLRQDVEQIVRENIDHVRGASAR